MELSALDRALLAGEEGPAAQLAMRILSRMARVRGARRMLDIEGAHIDSTIYVGDAGLEFAERLANLGARVRVPSTLNVSGVDEFGWREWSVPPEWAEKAGRQMRAYASMGTTPTWTCAPYQTEFAPRFGQQIAWGESNAVCFANSVLGARTERYPDLLDICAAVTGRAPAVGLHLEENRLATRVLKLRGIPESLAARDDWGICSGPGPAWSRRRSPGCRGFPAKISSRRWGRRRPPPERWPCFTSRGSRPRRRRSRRPSEAGARRSCGRWEWRSCGGPATS